MRLELVSTAMCRWAMAGKGTVVTPLVVPSMTINARPWSASTNTLFVTGFTAMPLLATMEGGTASGMTVTALVAPSTTVTRVTSRFGT